MTDDDDFSIPEHYVPLDYFSNVNINNEIDICIASDEMFS